MVIDGIKADPAWKGGDYKTQPQMGLRIAVDMLILAGSASHQMQKSYPTRDAADAFVADYLARVEKEGLDANDMLYAIDSSRNYDPRLAASARSPRR
jgi:homoserine O-acetyltransferase